MFRNSRFKLVVVTATAAILFTTLSSACAADGSAYGEKDLTFKEFKSQKEGKVEITFTAKPESMY